MLLSLQLLLEQEIKQTPKELQLLHFLNQIKN